MSVKRGFCVSVVSEIPDFFFLNSGFKNPGFRISLAHFFPDSGFRKVPKYGQQKACNVARFTTHVQTCKQPDLLQDRFDVGGITRNIAIQLVCSNVAKNVVRFLLPVFP